MVEHRAAHDRSGSGAPRHSSRANVVPAAVGPRLQTGDLLRISGGDFIVIALRKNKAAVRAFCRPGAREFTVTFEYALAMRFFAPNTPYRVWKDRAPRYSRFFGPNVRATLKKFDVQKYATGHASNTNVAAWQYPHIAPAQACHRRSFVCSYVRAAVSWN